jgi:hypothetical protein
MNYLLAPYVAALVTFVAELRGGLANRPVRIRLAPWAMTVLLMTAYALQLAILRTAALSNVSYRGLQHGGYAEPIPVIFPLFPNADALGAAFVALGLVQSALMVNLYRARLSPRLLWVGCAVNVALSVAAPVLGSFDLYGYVHDALLGRAAYAPPPVPFTGEYRIFDLWWGGKPTTTLYGPLWIPIVQLVTALAPTLLGKLLVYRAFSALLFCALLALLRAYGQPQRIVAAVALNPAFAFLTVANGHNDIICIVTIVAAAMLLRSSCVLAILMVALAGVLKLPYALLGLPIFSSVRNPTLRLGACVAVVVLAGAFSLIGGGENYVSALRQHSGKFDAAEAAQGAIVVVALVLLGLAVAGRRRYVTGVWFMPSFGSFRMPWTFPWYTLFAFPYALARRRVLRYLLVSMPFVTALITPEMMQTWTFVFAIPAAAVLSLRLRRGKGPAPA